MKHIWTYVAACVTVMLSTGCFVDRFEPNNDSSTATLIGVGTETDLSISIFDEDWFQIEVQEGQIGTLGIEYTYFGLLNNLGLWVYDGEENLLGYSQSSRNPLRPFGKAEEYLSVLSLSGSKDFIYAAGGAGNRVAVNSYDLTMDLAPYSDGSDCVAHYDLEDCLGRVDGEVKLYQFPFPDPDDGFVGDGYMFETYSNYRWARREAIMYLRYALQAVQQQFSGTVPLAIIDISQRDGLTPGMDIGILRHPETSHDQGGNIDVAYYQTGPDNSARVICDGEGGSHDGYHCDESSVDTHIVDLERTAYFLAKLACMPDCENTRLRVVGVDQVIGPLLDKAALELKNSSIISEDEFINIYNRLAYGDGWPYHHHHIHLSFKWWEQAEAKMLMPGDSPETGCGFRMPGDGLLQ